MKLSIEYAYRRDIYQLDQQELIYNDICLKDEQTVIETKLYESGSIFFIGKGLMEIEDYRHEAKKEKIEDITESLESKLT